MADFFTINGWEPSVMEGSFARSIPWKQALKRAFGGSTLDHRVAECRMIEGTAVWQEPRAGDNFRRLINGEGEYFDFSENKLYSARGVKPETAGTFVIESTNGVNGTPCVRVTGASTFTILQPTLEYYWSGRWTILFSHKIDTEATTAHTTYGVRSSDSASEQWSNGSQGTHNMDNMLDFTDVAGTGFEFAGSDSDGTDENADYDNIVILPFEASDTQMALWSVDDFTFSRLPYIDVQMESEAAAREYRGSCDSIKYKQARGAAWTLDGKPVPFKLEEKCDRRS